MYDYENRTPLNLNVFLFIGGASSKAKSVQKAIASDGLGEVRKTRLHLVRKIYECLKARLVRGYKFVSVESAFIDLRWFYRYVDSLELDPTVENILTCYMDWSVSIYKRQLENKISESVGFKQVRSVGKLLEDALGISPGSLTKKIVVLAGSTKKYTLSIADDKKVLSDSIAFGRDMADIARCLTMEVFNESPPFEIKFADGAKFHYFNRNSKTIILNGDSSPVINCREGFECSWSVGQRNSFINLRVEAELEIFISQTGANSGQVVGLSREGIQIGRFLNAWNLKAYKPRRRGEVSYEVFSEYQKHLKKYLDFYDQCFPDVKDGPLFPLVGHSGLSFRKKYTGNKIRNFLTKLGKKYIASSFRRNTRENWIARSSEDPFLAANMANHSLETHVKSYSRPNLIVASKEFTEFFSIQHELLISVDSGGCEGTSQRASFASEFAPAPDCRNAAGCLFCTSYKGINSFDYVWSLVSYRKMKNLELAGSFSINASDSSATAVLARIKELLQQFVSLGDENRDWYRDAVMRVEEGSYHQRWSIVIQIMENL